MSTATKALPGYQKKLHKLFFFSRLTEFARFCNRNSVMILCYHGITERDGPDPENESAVVMDRKLFLRQLEYLKRNYHVIALRDYLLARQTGQTLPQHSVILTFDDGLRNFLTVAAPMLNNLGLPATMFLVTRRVDSRGQSSMGSNWVASDDRNSLSWSEAANLQFGRRIEFGSHTCTHQELTQLGSSEIDLELSDSYRSIRKNLVDSIPPSLAYPYGFYSESIAQRARSAGYSCALTTDAGSNSLHTDLFQLRRAVVRSYDTIDIFAARVSGLIGWLRIGRSFFQWFSSPLVRVWNSALSQ